MKKYKFKLITFLCLLTLVLGCTTQNVYCSDFTNDNVNSEAKQILQHYKDMTDDDIFIHYIYPENDIYYGCGFSIYNINGKPIEYSFEPTEKNIMTYIEYIKPIFNRNNNPYLEFKISEITHNNDNTTSVIINQTIHGKNIYACKININFNENNEIIYLSGKIEDRYSADILVCNPYFPEELLPDIQTKDFWTCYFYNVNDSTMHYAYAINIDYYVDGLRYSKNEFYDVFTGEFLDKEDLWVIRD